MTATRVLYQPTATEHLADGNRTYCGRQVQGTAWARWDVARQVSWYPARKICQACENYRFRFIDVTEADVPGWIGRPGVNEPGAERHSKRQAGAE